MLYNTDMKRIKPKTEDFSGPSIFLRMDRSFEVLESETLPEGFVFGFDFQEEGKYYANTVLGALCVVIGGEGENGGPPDIEILPWSTFSGVLGDYSYTGGAVIPSRQSHDMFVLTDDESDGAHQDGEPIFTFSGSFADGNADYSNSFVEIGNSMIVPNQPMSIDKETGDINWMYLDSEDRPSFPFGYRHNRSVVNEKYFVFIHRNDDLVVLDTETGDVIEQVPLGTLFPAIDYPEEGNLFQLFGEDEFLFTGDDYDLDVGRGYILTVDEEAAPGSRISVVEHPASGALSDGKRVFWGWYEFSYYFYWGIWNNCFYLDREDESYYLFYFTDADLPETGSLIKFNSSHQIEWVFDLEDLPEFANFHYTFYQFVKAAGKIALLPCYGNSNDPSALHLIDDDTGDEISLPASANEKILAYTDDRNFINIVYPKNPSGSKIPFIGNFDVLYDEEELLYEEAIVYGYFDVDTLEWVDNVDSDFVGDSAFLAYPLDGVTAVLQKEADGGYFYMIDISEGSPLRFKSQYLVRINSELDSISYEKLDFGAEKISDIISSAIQSALCSDGRIYGITRSNQIFSSSPVDRPRRNEGETIVLEKDKWYDFKSDEWNTGFRPFASYSLNPNPILVTSALPSNANFIPMNSFSDVLNMSTGIFTSPDSNLSARSTTLAPDNRTLVCVSTASNGASRFLDIQDGVLANPEGYPFYSIAHSTAPRRYLFRDDGTPIVVRASGTQTIVMRHSGTEWIADSTVSLASASGQRYFMYNDTLYAFRATEGGDAIISEYDWDTPGWTTFFSAPTPVGTNTYYDDVAVFGLENMAYKDNVFYFSNGFEFDILTGQFTEIPYPETFYSVHRESGNVSGRRITLQVWGDYLIAYYSSIGGSYIAFRPLEEGLPPPF